MSFSDGRDRLRLKVMTLHGEPSWELLRFSCRHCWLLNRFAEQVELSNAKWEACMDCKADNSSGSVVVIDWGPQEWDSTLCATELGFLNILQIAHASCLMKVKYEKNAAHIFIFWTSVLELNALSKMLTLAGIFLSFGVLGREGSLSEGSLYSCIIQSVLIPLAALPL